MAVSFVAATSNQIQNVATLSIAKPAGVESGDLLLCSYFATGNAAVVTPAGWNVVHDVAVSGVTQDRHALYWRWVDGGEPASWVFGDPNGPQFRNQSGIMVAYRGVTSPPIVVDAYAVSVGATAGRVAPALVFDYEATVVAYFADSYSAPDGQAGAYVIPAGTTMRAKVQAQPAHLLVDYPSTGGASSKDAGTIGANGETISGQVALRGNVPPHAPNVSVPAVVAVQEATAVTVGFNDPNPDDSPSAARIRFRLTDGVSPWSEVYTPFPVSQVTIPADTLVEGDYELQGQSTDALGLVGPWSGSVFFSAASRPPGPTITDPANGGIIPTETYAVVWSTPDQDAYQLRTVADNAGAPNTATVYTDTGIVASTAVRSRTLTFATNGRVEHIQVRTQYAGLWSDWASVKVTVSYTAPAAPTVTVDPDSPAGAISMQATHPAPTGSQPTVNSVDWWRQELDEDGNPIGEPIALARGAGRPAAATFVDWQIASGRHVRYRARARGANDTSTFSEWTP